MKIQLISFFLLVTLSCKKTTMITNNKEKMNINNSKDSIRKVLDRQILNGYAIKEKGLDAISDYKYSIDDYNASADTSVEILKKNGVQFLDSESFNNKIKEIFGFPDNTSPLSFLVEYPCPTDKLVFQLDDNYVISNNNPIFIDKERKILTEAFFIPELIEYKKDFSDVYEKEDKILKEKTIANDKVQIIRWKDLSDLDEKRQNNIQKLINRNRYLFNNNKGSYAWLQFNDKIFLECLIKTFGYVKDKDLLEWYIKRNGIEKYLNNLDEYIKIFFVKTCDKRFIVHHETFDYFDKNPEKYSKDILKILDEIQNNKIQLDGFTFEEKSKLIAYLLYFGEKHKGKTDLTFAFMGSFYERQTDDLQKKYDEEFKKQKYYGLPEFENYWNNAKNEGDGIGLDM
ncbi:hypothetical protein [Chryseobacterium sp. OSA05B]|uniref:hypothetical protein n=1 Tax=Chryseobacterium sp. OSA05B TaxID=2862650 RepID=UPI001CC14C0B|nr:hypothetical protein [Chryseobacterium sp. OSA05B]